MSALPLILINTPWWVFLLFALLVWLGVQALRPRAVRLRALGAGSAKVEPSPSPPRKRGPSTRNHS